MGPELRGAYGFRLVMDPSLGRLPDLPELDEDAPGIAFEWRHASLLVEREILDGDRVSLGIRGGSGLEVRREPASILLELAEEPTLHSLVHPLLTTPMSILARWRGDLTLHAGSFFANGRSWAVIGAREAGKSTMVATLGERGCPLVADDLLVLDGETVHAGPACVDLRPDVVARVEGARSLGVVGGRHRYRLSTSQGPARSHLGGFFLLDWSDDAAVAIEEVAPSERLRLLCEHDYIGLLGPADPRQMLDLLEIPMWQVRRPRDWAATSAAADGILALTERL